MLIDQASHPAILAVKSGVICAQEFFKSVYNMKNVQSERKYLSQKKR